MMVLIMGAAFSGYVLVGSQISYWAAMVITSLIGVLPLKGSVLMYWVWGGYTIR
jgi:quinol-cytochrome oxidoreductase complex cytochrome b subunit